MSLNQWMMFEHDVCSGCNHPKLAKVCPAESQLQVIISCDCDMTVFDHAWKACRDNDQLMVIVDYSVEDFIKELAKMLSEKP